MSVVTETIHSFDAALAASIFHYEERGIRELKEHLWARGVPVRR